MSPLNIPGLETERPYEYVAAFLPKPEADAYFEKIMAELKPKMGPADTYGRVKGSKLDCSSAFSGYRESLWIGPAINPGKSEARRCSHGPEEREWPAVLKDIRERVESETGQKFNSCLVNFYPHGKSGISDAFTRWPSTSPAIVTTAYSSFP
jgi:hypothetical protein